MSTSPEFVEYLCDQLEGTGEIRARKMFGEYMIYCNDKPVLLVCGDTPFAKMLPCVADLLRDRPRALPYEGYEGTKLHYVLDPDDRETLRRAVALLEEVTPVPKKRSRGKTARRASCPPPVGEGGKRPRKMEREEKTQMIIRQAREEDYPAIYDLVKTAFATAKVSDGTEQDFVLELRRRDTYLPELELVAEEDGRLAGHIMLTGQPVPGSPEGFRGLLVAPLCVRLEDRSRGLGGRLLQAAGDLARERGYHALFLVGDPDYYGRYGFAPAVSRGFQNTTGVPDRFVQVLELRPGALDGAGGELDLH